LRLEAQPSLEGMSVIELWLGPVVSIDQSRSSYTTIAVHFFTSFFLSSSVKYISVEDDKLLVEVDPYVEENELPELDKSNE